MRLGYGMIFAKNICAWFGCKCALTQKVYVVGVWTWPTWSQLLPRVEPVSHQQSAQLVIACKAVVVVEDVLFECVADGPPGRASCGTTHDASDE